MKVNIKKSSIPIIWLDTNILIELKNHENGWIREASKKQKPGIVKRFVSFVRGLTPKENLERKRIAKLYNTLTRKIDERKLICPEGIQSDEYDIGDDNTFEVQADLARGIKFKIPHKIIMTQIAHAIQLFHNRDGQMVVAYVDAFKIDPVQQIKAKGMIISVHFPETEMDHTREKRKNTLQSWKQIKQDARARGITFEQQLEIEYAGFPYSLDAPISQWLISQNAGATASLWEWLDFQAAFDTLLEIHSHTGSSTESKRFFVSEEYKAVPFIDIHSRLCADLMTSEANLWESDLRDLYQLSIVIPYCDFVMTDKARKNQLRRLGIDKKYRTAIYSLQDVDDLVLELEKL